MQSDQILARLAELAPDPQPVGVGPPAPAPPGTLEEATERIAQLETALEHRTVIAQATGMVMERFGLDAEAAFAVLVRLSSQSNIKVYDLAQEIVVRGPSVGSI